MALQDEVGGYFAEVHDKTRVGRVSARTDADVVIDPTLPDGFRDTMKHLLNMVDALEETVKLLARAIDGRY